jgi:hypothetical protein
MAVLVVNGYVPESFKDQSQFYLKLDPKNECKALDFYKNNKITTRYRPGGISIAKKSIVAHCKAGDYIQVIFEDVERSNGIGIKAIDFKKL